jgi:hypothetical protein
MNTYNDNQLTTVKGILSNIGNESLKKNSAKTVAHYNLFYAVGSQRVAQGNYDHVNLEFDCTLDINDQGVACSNRANNLLASAQLANQYVTTVVTNTATVAQNVQVAVNAVLKLSANIGSAMNIVSASEYDTDIQRMTNEVNKIIKETAYHAELASQYAMESSTQASRIISKEVLQEANSTKTLFDGMLQCTQTDLDKLAAVRITNTSKLIAANSTVRVNEGIFYETQEECEALDDAYVISNHDLNFALTTEVESITKINIRFNAFKPPFGQATSDKDCSSFPPPKYFITVIKADTKDMFSYDMAETAFNSNKEECFVSVNPQIPNLITIGDKQSLSKDANGKEITPGTPYVAVLYLELDHTYKKTLNDYDDRISATSNTFVLATILDEKFTSCNSDSNSVIKFKGTKEEPANAEHRCILLPTQSLCTKDSKSHCIDDATPDTTEIWFDLNIATQVSADNYKTATITDPKSFYYEVNLGNEPTDCFGALLIEEQTYIPVILAIVPNTDPKANTFASTLSKLEPFIWHDEKDDEKHKNND